MKIHVWKTKEAIKAANRLLQRYPPHIKSGEADGKTTTRPRKKTTALPESATQTSQKRPIKDRPNWQQPTERTTNGKQNSQNEVSSTTDISPARRDLHRILRTMNLVSIKLDEAIILSIPSQDIGLELHASQEDIAISEAEGESRKDGQKIGRVPAIVRKKKLR